MTSPGRLAALIAGWTHEAEVAEANQRADEYANTCRDTVEALREAEQLREAMRVIAAQSSGIPGSTRLSDCMAAIASAALRYS